MQISLTNKREEFITRLQRILNDHIEDPNLRAELIASTLGLSKSTLNRKLKSLNEKSINAYVRKYRLHQALKILSAGYSITEVSKKVGFRSASYFSYCFKVFYNYSPRQVFRQF